MEDVRQKIYGLNGDKSVSYFDAHEDRGGHEARETRSQEREEHEDKKEKMD